ncbi:MAG: TRAP transporter large permease [Clostridia bacterium]|nr:TRAP transporter large permease [Clostridia bacterium]
MAIIILLVGLLVIMLFGVPLSISIFCISAFVSQVFTDIPFWQLMQKFFFGIDSFVLTAIPFFLLAGNIMNEGKITDRLMTVSSAFVGHIRGGLAHVNVLVSMLFGGVSGSAVADTSGVGTVIIPAMVKKAYSKSFSVGITCVSSVLGQIIPPSIIMIIYAAAADTSIQAMFLAGAIPGVLIGLSLMGVSYVYALKYHYPKEKKFTLKERLIALKGAFLTMLMPLIIIGGVITGIFTATESSVIAVFYSVFLTLFVYKTLDIKKLKNIFINSAKTSAVTLFCIGSANIFGYLLAYFRVNKLVEDLILSLNLSPSGYILFIIGLFMILGTFMDAVPAIYIFVPIVVPVGISLGLHPVHIGMIICLVLAFGLVTPPYGLCLLLASNIAGVNAKTVFKDLFVLLFVVMMILLIIVFVPDIILFLPKLIVPKYM